MPSIAVDAGPLVALFSRRDRHHAAALEFFRSTQGNFVTNIAVLTETAHLLSFSAEATRDALGWVAAAFDIDQHTATDLPRIVEIMAKYDDLPADFADASMVAMCERLGIKAIATLDNDFEVYRLTNGDKLRNVFEEPGSPAP